MAVSKKEDPSRLPPSMQPRTDRKALGARRGGAALASKKRLKAAGKEEGRRRRVAIAWPYKGKRSNVGACSTCGAPAPTGMVQALMSLMKKDGKIPAAVARQRAEAAAKILEQ